MEMELVQTIAAVAAVIVFVLAGTGCTIMAVNLATKQEQQDDGRLSIVFALGACVTWIISWLITKYFFG